MVGLVVCGDDEDVASKPSPEVIPHIARHFGVAPGSVAMVGDTNVDVATGRTGGAGAVIGVIGSGGRPTGADALIATIEELVGQMTR